MAARRLSQQIKFVTRQMKTTLAQIHFPTRPATATVARRTATVTVTVTPVNDLPLAIDDVVDVLEDTAHTIQVLENDVEVDGETLAVTIDEQPAHGIASIEPSGAITYTPNANYFGPDSIVYRVVDGAGENSTATVSISVESVNDNPVASGLSLTTNEDVLSVAWILQCVRPRRRSRACDLD